MAVVVTSLGTASTAGGTPTVVLGGLTIPANSFIFVSIFEKNNSLGTGSISDTTPGGGFLGVLDKFPNNDPTLGAAGLRYIGNYVEFAGDSIIYTKADSGSYAAITGLWASGVIAVDDPLDRTARIFATGGMGTGTTPTASINATTASKGDLLIGNVMWDTDAGDSFTQDTGHPFVVPPNSLLNSGASAGIAGGYYVIPNSQGLTGGITYAPTLGHANPWICYLAPFQTVPVPDAVPADDVTVMGM